MPTVRGSLCVPGIRPPAFVHRARPREKPVVDQYRADGWFDLNNTYTYRIVHKKLLVD